MDENMVDAPERVVRPGHRDQLWPQLGTMRDLRRNLAQDRFDFRLKAKARNFEASYNRFDYGAFTMIDIAAGKCSGYLPHAGANNDGQGTVGVTVMLKGRQRLLSTAGDLVLNEGDVLVLDKAKFMGFESPSDVRQCTLLLGRKDAFAHFSWINLAMGKVVTSDDPQMRLFVSYLRAVADESGALSAAGSRSAGQATVELLRAGLAAAVGDRAESQREVRRSNCRAYVESRLTDPTLSPTAVADRFGMSVRSLYDLFSGERESVAAFIRRRRLERCRDDLETFETMPVTEIAFRWGFDDSSNFTRSFRSHFGCSPTEYRALARIECEPARLE